MAANRKILLFIAVFAAYVVRELWTLLPYSDLLIQPFPLSEQQITFQSYVWIAGIYSFQLIVVYLIHRAVPHWFLAACFILQSAEFAEYFLCYNNPWFTVFGFNVNVTNIRFWYLFLLIIKYLLHVRSDNSGVGRGG